MCFILLYVLLVAGSEVWEDGESHREEAGSFEGLYCDPSSFADPFVVIADVKAASIRFRCSEDQVWNLCAGLFSHSLVSVVEKFISEIDQLPPRFKDVETLFLSNNSITTLSGIEQFPALRVLSIANNLVRSILFHCTILHSI